MEIFTMESCWQMTVNSRRETIDKYSKREESLSLSVNGSCFVPRRPSNRQWDDQRLAETRVITRSVTDCSLFYNRFYPFAEVIIAKKKYLWDIIRSRRECFSLLEGIWIHVFETHLLQTEPSIPLWYTETTYPNTITQKFLF